MHYDFENVGGLLQVIAVPPASFVQIRKDYAAGLNYLETPQPGGYCFHTGICQ